MYNLSQLKDEENCNNKNFNWLRKCIAFFSLKKKIIWVGFLGLFSFECSIDI